MLNFKHLNYFYTVAKTGAVNRAADKLHVAPQTLSGQLTQFEARLGVALFRRTGRRLELTDIGRVVLSYAEELFQVGAELEQTLRDSREERTFPFRVGIADVVPKSIAHQLLAPALAQPEPVRLICREDRLDRLLGELAIHRIDMVLADRPMPPGMDVKGYSHALGECGVAFYTTPDLAAGLTGVFPACLNGAPLLIPGADSALRAPLMRWLERNDIRPRIVGEFDDSALMKAFGKAGAGIFPAPVVTGSEVESQYGVLRLGETRDLRERFFAISVERKVTHPAVLAILEAASQALFA
ncbi:MAG: transcriptional activator NhaR [Hydrogenophilales bacterium 28-61-23]|nr:MAG: transcriptional activator NhaR [Hydrogenophilales bacterium 28-61-23]